MKLSQCDVIMKSHNEIKKKEKIYELIKKKDI